MAHAESLSSSLRVHALFKRRSLKLDIPPPKLFQARGGLLESYIDFGRVVRLDSVSLRGVFDEGFRIDSLPYSWDNKYLLTIKYHGADGKWQPLVESVSLSSLFLNACRSDDSVASLLDAAAGHAPASVHPQLFGSVHLHPTLARRLLLQLQLQPGNIDSRPAAALTNPPSVVFTHISDFDNNGPRTPNRDCSGTLSFMRDVGLLYWLATGGGRHVYENPALDPSNGVRLEISHQRMSRPSKMNRESIISHSYSSSQPIYWGGSAPIWFSVDLGPGRRFRPAAYSLRHGYHSSNSFLQNWEFQVSTDGYSWHTLHAGSKSGFSKAFDTKTFPVDASQSTAEPARFFRVVQRGNYGTTNSSASLSATGTPLMCIAGFELYGELFNTGGYSLPDAANSSTHVNTLRSLQVSWKSFDKVSAPALDEIQECVGPKSVSLLLIFYPSSHRSNEIPTRTFKYESDFDSNGLLYFIGTEGKFSSWTNPAKIIPGIINESTVKVEISDAELAVPSQTQKDHVIGRAPHIADVYWGKGSVNRWFSIDLSHKHRVRCSHMTFRNGLLSSASFAKLSCPNRVEIQGSHDGNVWRPLCTADLDESFSKNPLATTTVRIADSAATPDSSFYRYYKVIDVSVAPSSPATPEEPEVAKDAVFALGGFELYGEKLLPDDEEELEILVRPLSQENVAVLRSARCSALSSSYSQLAALRLLVDNTTSVATRRDLWRFLNEASRQSHATFVVPDALRSSLDKQLALIIKENILQCLPDIGARAVLFMTNTLASTLPIDVLCHSTLRAIVEVLSSSAIEALHFHDNAKMLFRLLKWSIGHTFDKSALLQATNKLAVAAVATGETVRDVSQKIPGYLVLRRVFGLYGNALEPQLFGQFHGAQGAPLFEEPSRSNAESPALVTYEQLAHKRFTEETLRKDISEAYAEVQLTKSALLKALDPIISDSNDMSSVLSSQKRADLVGCYHRSLDALNIQAILQRHAQRLGTTAKDARDNFSASLDRNCWIAKETLAIVRDVLVRLAPGDQPSQLEWLWHPNSLCRLFSAFCVNSGDSTREKCADLISQVLSRSASPVVAQFIQSVLSEHFGDASDDISPYYFLFESLLAILSSPVLKKSASTVLLDLVKSQGKGVSESSLPWISLLISSLLLGHKQQAPHPYSRCSQCSIGPIRGFRWKCLNCADHELCSHCEKHPQQIKNHVPKTHALLKIPHPLQLAPLRDSPVSRKPLAPKLFYEDGHTPLVKQNAHRGAVCGSCSMSPIIGIRWQCSSCANYHLCDKCETKFCSGPKESPHPWHHFFVKFATPVATPNFSDSSKSIINLSLHPFLYPSSGSATPDPSPADSKAAIRQRLLDTESLPFLRSRALEDVQKSSCTSIPASLTVSSLGGQAFSSLWSAYVSLLSNPQEHNLIAIISVSRTLQQLSPSIFSSEDIASLLGREEELSRFAAATAALEKALSSTDQSSSTQADSSDWWTSGAATARVSYAGDISSRGKALLRSEVFNTIQSLLSESSGSFHQTAVIRACRLKLRTLLINQAARSLRTDAAYLFTIGLISCISSTSDLDAELVGPIVSWQPKATDASSVAYRTRTSENESFVSLVGPLLKQVAKAAVQPVTFPTNAVRIYQTVVDAIKWAWRAKIDPSWRKKISFPTVWRAIRGVLRRHKSLQASIVESLSGVLTTFSEIYPEKMWCALASEFASLASSSTRTDETFADPAFSHVLSAVRQYPLPPRAAVKLLSACAVYLPEAFELIRICDRSTTGFRASVFLSSKLLPLVLKSLRGADASELEKLAETIKNAHVFIGSKQQSLLTALLTSYGSFDVAPSKRVSRLLGRVLSILLCLAAASVASLQHICALAFEEFKSHQTSMMKDLVSELACVSVGSTTGASVFNEHVGVVDFVGRALSKFARPKVASHNDDASVSAPTASAGVLETLHLAHGARKIAAQEAAVSRSLASSQPPLAGAKPVFVIPASAIANSLPVAHGLENLNSLASVVSPVSEISRLQNILRVESVGLGVSWMWNFATGTSLVQFGEDSRTKKPADPIVAIVLEFATTVHIEQVRISFSDTGAGAAADSCIISTAIGSDAKTVQFRVASVGLPPPPKDTEEVNGGFRNGRSITVQCSLSESCRFLKIQLQCPKKLSQIAVSRIQILGFSTPFLVLVRSGMDSTEPPKQSSESPDKGKAKDDVGTFSLSSALASLSAIHSVAPKLPLPKLRRLLELLIDILDRENAEQVLLRLVEADVFRVAPEVFEMLLSSPSGESGNKKSSGALGRVLAMWNAAAPSTPHPAGQVPWNKLVSRIFESLEDPTAVVPIISALADAMHSEAETSEAIFNLNDSAVASDRARSLLSKTTPDATNNRSRQPCLRLMFSLLRKSSNRGLFFRLFLSVAQQVGASSYPSLLLLAASQEEAAELFVSSPLSALISKEFASHSPSLATGDLLLLRSTLQALRTCIAVSGPLTKWISSELAQALFSWPAEAPSALCPVFLPVLRLLISIDAPACKTVISGVVSRLRSSPIEPEPALTKFLLELMADFASYESPLFARVYPRPGVGVDDFRSAVAGLGGSFVECVKFDPTKCDRGLVVSEDRQTLTVPADIPSFQWRSVFAEKPIVRSSKSFELVMQTIPTNMNLMVGLSERPPDLPPCIGQNANYKSWVWSCTNHGPLYSAGQVISSYGRSVQQGDVLGIHIDFDAGTLSYSINGDDLGVAFSNVFFESNDGLYPAFSVISPNVSIRLQSPHVVNPELTAESEPYAVQSALGIMSGPSFKIVELRASATVANVEDTVNTALESSKLHCQVYVGENQLSRSDKVGKSRGGSVVLELGLGIRKGQAPDAKEAVQAEVATSSSQSASALIQALVREDSLFDFFYGLSIQHLRSVVKEEQLAVKESVTSKLLDGADNKKQRGTRRSNANKSSSVTTASFLEFLDAIRLARAQSGTTWMQILEDALRTSSTAALLAVLLSQVSNRVSPSVSQATLPEVEELAAHFPAIVLWDGLSSKQGDAPFDTPISLFACATVALSRLSDLSPVVPSQSDVAPYFAAWQEQMKAREDLRRLKRELEVASKASSSKLWAKGTGYGTESDDSASGGDSASKWSHERYMRTSATNQKCIVKLLQFVRLSFRGTDAERSVLQASCFTPLLESYLRNDSLIDLERSAPLYVEIFQLVRFMVAKHPTTASALLLSPLRADSSDSLEALISRLHKIAVAAETVAKKKEKAPIESAPTPSPRPKSRRAKAAPAPKSPEQKAAELILLPELTATFDELCTLKKSASSTPSESTKSDTSTMEDKDTDESYRSRLEEYLFGELEMSNPEATTLREKYAGHHYDARVCQEVSPAPAKMKRLINEISALSVGLPLHSNSSVFLRIDSERMDVMKFGITGPKGTPYESGFFVFDLFCPAEYPSSPPLVNLQTTGNGTMRFNPNLYNCGKVCLSLLGTWRGGPNEQWSEQTSTLLQVFVSIQSLILVEDPYFNEPGYEGSMGTPEGKAASAAYSENIKLGTLRWAILEQLRNPAKGFEELINLHFLLKKPEIIRQCDMWLKEAKLFAQNPPPKVNNGFGSGQSTAAPGVNYEKMKQLCEEIKSLLSKLESGENVRGAGASSSSSSSVNGTDEDKSAAPVDVPNVARWIGTDELMDAFASKPLGLLYKALELNNDALHDSLEWLFFHGDTYLKENPELVSLRPPASAYEAMTERQLQNLKRFHYLPTPQLPAASNSSLPSVILEFEDYGAMDQGYYDYEEYNAEEDYDETQFF